MPFGLCWLVLTAFLVDAWPRSALAEPAHVQDGQGGICRFRYQLCAAP